MSKQKRTTTERWQNTTPPSSSRRPQPGRWRLGAEYGPHVTIVRENLNCQYHGEYDIRITTRRTVVEDGNRLFQGPGGTHSVAVVQGCQKAKRIAERLYAALVNTEAPDHQGDSHDWI
tara:strand:+ start:8465 stop:8818 length:354 start_codon:yes stop_codon:yes gene_type:complete